ncbi:uncharacterized protein LOC121386138 [Gigantopelta aegis]|uniref:uncharacterized protein LOC121386138 n=1 Tax=Gigantopelta aegis TaxID=1735272 RepID=UPI001B88A9B8|nr:uncharacterized protein LOC121386138 [Gigantopelta aegis]
MSLDIHWTYQLIVIVLIACSEHVLGVCVFSMSKSMAVTGQSLVFNYETEAAITLRIAFCLNDVIAGACERLNTNDSLCNATDGYTLTPISPSAVTLQIRSFDAAKHAGVWRLRRGKHDMSKTYNLTAPFGTVVKNSLINLASALPSSTQVNFRENFHVNVIIGCAFPSVNVFWVFGDNKTLTPVITTDDTGCKSPLVKTIAVLTMNGEFMTGPVDVYVKLIHPSFENEVHDKKLGSVLFPVHTAVDDRTEVYLVFFGWHLCHSVASLCRIVHTAVDDRTEVYLVFSGWHLCHSDASLCRIVHTAVDDRTEVYLVFSGWHLCHSDASLCRIVHTAVDDRTEVYLVFSGWHLCHSVASLCRIVHTAVDDRTEVYLVFSGWHLCHSDASLCRIVHTAVDDRTEVYLVFFGWHLCHSVASLCRIVHTRPSMTGPRST